MSPLLQAALAEVEPLLAARGWTPPGAAVLREAQALLDATAMAWPAPAVAVEPDGAVALEWEAAGRGWLKLSVRGRGELAHEAVIGGDEFEQAEPWTAAPDAAALPGWAHELLRRLWPCDA
ncbi:hypothetical protein [Azohydromonas aeria]|uniref:hypothetical protein n=1 Tax=Azohydromonas aeria TaxID=2590212 RepID=UPI0012F9BEBE|nr:hypothetical protein [Azohydromonas aeria]